MKLLKTIYFGLVALLIFTACGQPQNNKSQVRDLKKQLYKLEKLYQSIDIECYSDIFDAMKIQSDSLMKAVSDKQVDPEEFLTTLGKFTAAQKILSRQLDKSYKPINSEIKRAKKQIDDLMHDIKKGYIPTDSIPLYVQQEQVAIESLKLKVSSIEKTLNEQKQVYETTLPAIQELLHKYANK